MNRLAGFLSWRPRALHRVHLALLAVLTVVGTGCGSDPEPPPPTSPQVTERTQSAVNVMENGTVTFHVAATDDAQRPLSFSWDANAGVLAQPTSTATASDVTWTGPACLPAGTRIQVTVTITNDVAPATTQSFPLSVVPCPVRTHVSAGAYASVVSRFDRTVWGWGDTFTSASDNAPHQVPVLPEVWGLASGNSFSLVLGSEGTVWAWGRNDSGQLGDGTTDTREWPVRVKGLTDIVAISAGRYSALALRKDGTVWAWGENTRGQLGDGTTVERHEPVQVQGVSRATGIAAGGEHSLAVLADGTVMAWGHDSSEELGSGRPYPRLDSPTPLPVLRLKNVAAVSASSGLSLALHVDGTVSSWGTNVDGVLGRGNPLSGPAKVPQVTRAIGVFAGTFYALALLEDGTVQAWGTNDAGQLGDGTYKRHEPAPVPGLSEVIALSAGAYHALAMLSDGSVRAWGDNTSMQLGTPPDVVNHAGPVQVLGLTEVSQVAAGQSHSLALRADGTVWAWGSNDDWPLGMGDAHGAASKPVQVPLLTGGKGIAAGMSHSLAVRADGTVLAWGSNFHGQLGKEDFLQGSDSAQPIAGLTGVTAVAARRFYSLALREDGTVWAWGDNPAGQLGVGTPEKRGTPAAVAGLTQATAISAGDGHVLALRADGTIWAWGANGSGQLGDGTTTARFTPAQVPGLTGVIAVAAGREHSLALREDGTVWVWGSNSGGQFGDGTLLNFRASPAPVVGLTGGQRIAAGDFHSMVAVEGGPLVTFGNNYWGQLGLGSGNSGQFRGGIPSLPSARAVAGGYHHSLAVAADGTVWAWGDNVSGQLGTGEAANSPRPIPVTLEE